MARANALAPLLLMVAAAAPAGAAEPCGAAGLPPLQPLERRAPDYPDGARSVGVEGYVDVQLTVLRDGRTGWVRVRRAEPAGLFEQSALDAVRDWRFAPVRRRGVAVECTAEARVRFALSDEVMPGRRESDGPGRPFPPFPDEARERGLEGHVRVEYSVDPDGQVRDLAIVESVPRGAFDDAVRDTLAAWRYAPGSGPRGLASREFRFRLPAYARPDPSPQNTPAAYPAELCAERVKGRVALDVDLDADGRVTGATVADATPAGVFDREALRIAPQIRRIPARRGGLPVAAPARVTLDFDPARHCDAPVDGARLQRGGARPPRVGRAD